MDKSKTLFKDEKKCPYCHKWILIKRTKKVISKAVKGEYEEKTEVSKSEQTRLK